MKSVVSRREVGGLDKLRAEGEAEVLAAEY